MIRQLVSESLSIEFVVFDEEDPNGVGVGPNIGYFGRRATPHIILGTVGHVRHSPFPARTPDNALGVERLRRRSLGRVTTSAHPLQFRACPCLFRAGKSCPRYETGLARCHFCLPARHGRERALRGRKERRRFPPATHFWFSRSFTPRTYPTNPRPLTNNPPPPP